MCQFNPFEAFIETSNLAKNCGFLEVYLRIWWAFLTRRPEQLQRGVGLPQFCHEFRRRQVR